MAKTLGPYSSRPRESHRHLIGRYSTTLTTTFQSNIHGRNWRCYNMAARLSGSAEPGQIVVSNLVHRDLCGDMQKMLREARPVEAKNVGKIKAWVHDHPPA